MSDKERVWCKSPTPSQCALGLKQLKKGKHVSRQQGPTRKEEDALDKLRRYARNVQPTDDTNLDEVSKEDATRCILIVGDKVRSCNNCSRLVWNDGQEEGTECWESRGMRSLPFHERTSDQSDDTRGG